MVANVSSLHVKVKSLSKQLTSVADESKKTKSILTQVKSQYEVLFLNIIGLDPIYDAARN